MVVQKAQDIEARFLEGLVELILEPLWVRFLNPL